MDFRARILVLKRGTVASHDSVAGIWSLFARPLSEPGWPVRFFLWSITQICDMHVGKLFAPEQLTPYTEVDMLVTIYRGNAHAHAKRDSN